uniref:Reverse transcriptase domain-containing protein n=1 Tax=Sphaeramia orbicularis TaxID=375764 RepID=A0A672YI47_9TELE
MIRNNRNIIGIRADEEEHKISLYADNVLLKKEAMDINRVIPKQFKDDCEFQWPAEGIKYLGIVITPTQDKLYNVNYDDIIN